MANPSSSHHGERERDREHRHRSSSSSHHHHRTISSTTLLLILSLVLAVLAVMLSLPSSSSTTPDSPSGVMSYLTPKRTQALIARESAVAVREAEVARREAELLAGAPGGVISTPTPVAACPLCTQAMVTVTEIAPIQTIIKEIVKEDSLAPPGWIGTRSEELLDRELKIAERERDMGKREENVNRREHDAARRENWIMEQLVAFGNESPQSVQEEEYYEAPQIPVNKRKNKYQYQELPPIVVSEVYEPEIKTVIQTQTVTVPPPANTRKVAFPTPNPASPSTSASSPKTTAIEVITEEVEDRKPKPAFRGPPKRGGPAKWIPGW
ncbi:hypothetical protein CPB83DRAFT_806692 [Crepidotus variabilis]|uniref:Uncharacterized protein n=1 Tax=Crepidotus variabilis TaxID=179855 RepID=A0A9P6EQD7_9AGAR|nr:hypothetical protein CPB83DRAFT_806692 [Crepidotus variabilis]